MFKYEVSYKELVCVGVYNYCTRSTNDYSWFRQIVADCGKDIIQILIDNKVVWDSEKDSFDKIEKMVA